VKSKLETLRSQIMLGTLQQLKQASANGSAGFGQLSNYEGDTLRNSFAPLYQAQSVEALRQALRTVINTTEGSKERLKRGFTRLYGQEPQIKSYHTNAALQAQQPPSFASEGEAQAAAAAGKIKAGDKIIINGVKGTWQ